MHLLGILAILAFLGYVFYSGDNHRWFALGVFSTILFSFIPFEYSAFYKVKLKNKIPHSSMFGILLTALPVPVALYGHGLSSATQVGGPDSQAVVSGLEGVSQGEEIYLIGLIGMDYFFFNPETQEVLIVNKNTVPSLVLKNTEVVDEDND